MLFRKGRGGQGRYHFSSAVNDHDRLFCSGMMGCEPYGSAVKEPAQQFVRAFESLKSVLEAAGASVAAVVDLTTFHVAFQSHFELFMEVKDRYPKPLYPSWTAIGICELAVPGALLEIKIVARIFAYRVQKSRLTRRWLPPYRRLSR